jgi:hypothetical protein
MGWYPARVPKDATFVIGAETANVINVSIQLKDSGNVDLAVRGNIFAYLSDDANGDSLVATAPTTVAIGTDGTIAALVAGKFFAIWSEADGDIDINITLSAGAATYYLVLVMPSGKRVISGAITFAA